MSRAVPPTELRIEMLGRFRVSAGGRTVDEAAWRLRRARSLLKLLALAPEHRLHREQVIEALWPDREGGSAAGNLRQAVFVARRALDSCGVAGARWLGSNQEVLTLGAGGGLRLDVELFEAAATAVAGGDAAAHRRAIDLYAGELLPEDRFEQWAAGRREALRERHLSLLLEYALLLERDGGPAAAIDPLQRALLDDPLHERAHRELMRLFALTGRRQRALAQYHLLRESLRREFEDEPDAQTRRLYQDILARRPAGVQARETAPATRVPSVPRGAGNLPLQLTSFVGRARELNEIAGLMARARLLTLTGTGGCGKSRLALEAASGVLRDYRDGVWLVELSAVSDGELVAHAVATALGVESRSRRSSDAALVAHIGDRHQLLVLDTCEHLVEACARLAERLLTACPRLAVLATSREPLRVPGEVAWRVPSLSLPEATRAPSPEAVRRSEAVQLFTDRAANVSRFALTTENCEAVAAICRRLDGIPLAVELAAARTAVLTPSQIDERLRDSLAVLAGQRTGLTRQQTLTATIDWSHRLLGHDERVLFRRLGAFAGNCSLEAIEEVCTGPGLAVPAVLGVLGRLVDKSLVVVEEEAGTARYGLLDTIRHYARGRLQEAAETATVEARHRRHYVALAEALEPELVGPDPRAARRRLQAEHDDLSAALHRAVAVDPQAGLRLGAALWRFWHARGDRVEGARELEAAIAAAPAPTAARARALLGLSILVLRTGDASRGRSAGVEAIAVCRQIGDPLGEAEAWHQLAAFHWSYSSLAEFERCCAESRALGERIGARPAVAAVLHTMGVVAASRGDPAARALIDSSLQLLRRLPADGDPLLLPVAAGMARERPPRPGAPRLIFEETIVQVRRVRPAQAAAYALADRGAVVRDEGDVAAGRADFEHSLAVFRRLGDSTGTAQVLAQLGNLLSVEGEHDLARELHDESLSLREAAGDARGTGLCLSSLGLAAARAGDYARATTELGRARALFERTGDLPGHAAVLVHLAYLALDQRRCGEARGLLEEAVRLYTHVLDYSIGAGWASINLAALDADAGEPDRSRARVQQAVEHFATAGDRVGLAYCQARLSEAANAALTAE